jgi:hypothetical protein
LKSDGKSSSGLALRLRPRAGRSGNFATVFANNFGTVVAAIHENNLKKMF